MLASGLLMVLASAAPAGNLETYLQALTAADEKVRIEAARKIREFAPGPRVVPALVKALRDPSRCCPR